MGTTDEVLETQKQKERDMDDERLVAVPEQVLLSEKLVPEICDEIIVSHPREAKGKAKQMDVIEDLSDVETERIEPSSTQSTLATDLDEVSLISSQIGQTARSQRNKGESIISEHSEGEDETEEEENEEPVLVLRDPVRVRPHDYMARDVVAFLLNYPRRINDPDSTANVRFYNNEIKFRPYGILIDDFHTRAFRRFKLLEEHHGYIQWLFPIREQGLNHLAYPLQLHEAATIRSDPQMSARVVKSLALMLDFYGMAISETNPLMITRHSDRRICSKQYRNLVESYHNYLRITRIFKSLVELGQQDYVPSIMLFILAEQSEHGKLGGRDLKASMDRYWVYCMRERDAQACVANAIIWVRGDGEFPMDAYKKIVEKKQREEVWKFDAEEMGLGRGNTRHNTWITGRVMGRLRSLNS